MSLKAKVEAVIYAAEEPVTLAQLAGIFSGEVLEALPQNSDSALSPVAAEEPSSAGLFSTDSETAEAAEAVDEAAQEKKAARQQDRRVREALQAILDGLIAEYADSGRGMEIREIAGGYRMATKPEYHDAVRALVKHLKPPMKLSLQALETLAVVAYKQPVTGPEVSEIRGVDTGGVLGSLISRKLITTAGRKHVIGRPILYKTTKEFLLRFGLKDLNELPSVEEFEKMAGELTQPDIGSSALEAPSLDAVDDLHMPEAEGAAEEDGESQSMATKSVEASAGVSAEALADESEDELSPTLEDAPEPSGEPARSNTAGPEAVPEEGPQ